MCRNCWRHHDDSDCHGQLPLELHTNKQIVIFTSLIQASPSFKSLQPTVRMALVLRVTHAKLPAKGLSTRLSRTPLLHDYSSNQASILSYPVFSECPSA